jgi:hypothetical protein
VEDEADRRIRQFNADIERKRAEAVERARAAEVQAAEEEAQESKEREEAAAAWLMENGELLQKQKQPLIQEIERKPDHPLGYLHLGRFLVRYACMSISVEMTQFTNAFAHYADRGEQFWSIVPVQNEVLNAIFPIQEVLIEGISAYQKAVALAAQLNPYRTACIKLEYAWLLTMTFRATSGVPGIPLEALYYAREAEQDLRRHLRRYPDHVAALQHLAVAVAVYQDRDNVRGQRIASIEARIREARVRQELRVSPPANLQPPGGVEAPYPDNWAELADAIRKRDGYRCTQCGATDVELHVHHVVPLSQGGSNDPDNLTTLCDACHKEAHEPLR